MVEIKNREDLEAWLEDKPREVCVAIAARAALRSLPTLSHLIGKHPKKRNFENDLTSWLRCSLTSGVAAVLSTPKVTSAAAVDAAVFVTHAAADAAGDAVYAAAADAASHALAAVDTAAFAAGDASAAYAAAFWKAVERDASRLENGMAVLTLMQQPIWPDGPPGDFAEPTRAFLEYLGSKPELAFWGRWYERMAAGDPPDWEMQKEIALIDDVDWKKGAVHVSGLISEIEAEYLVHATPYSEQIELNPDTGRLHSIPVVPENANLYQTALDKVRDALDDLRPDGVLPQHCAALEAITKRLDRTLGRYSDNPQRVHDDFLLSAKQVQGLLDTKEIADGEEVDALCSDLITGSDDIRAADPVVKASVQARLQLRIEEMRVDDTEQVADALDDLADISEGTLKESSHDTAEVLRAIRYAGADGMPSVGPADRAETVDAIYRAAAQMSRSQVVIASVIRQLDKIANAYNRGEKWGKAAVGIARAIGMLLKVLFGG